MGAGAASAGRGGEAFFFGSVGDASATSNAARSAQRARLSIAGSTARVCAKPTSRCKCR